jgi:hypothetical protein
MAYDMWSVGVLALELLALGTPKVFAEVGRRTRAAVDRRLRGRGLHSFTLELNLSNSRTHS